MQGLSETTSHRCASMTEFGRVYGDVIVGNHFFEEPGYYGRYRSRYRRTLEHAAWMRA